MNDIEEELNNRNERKRLKSIMHVEKLKTILHKNEREKILLNWVYLLT